MPTILPEGGFGERIWVETKSWRYREDSKRKYLDSDGRNLKRSIFRHWDGVNSFDDYTISAHKQHFLDYAATRPNLYIDFWKGKPYEGFKPTENVTWFQVWKSEKRTWKVLERHGNSYRLSKTETETRDVAKPWIDASGVVTATTPQFRALQRFMAKAPESMQANAFVTSIGYPASQHGKEYADRQETKDISELASSNIRPFNLPTFYAIEAGESAAETLRSAVIDQFGRGEFAELQKKFAAGELDEATIEELRENITDQVESLLGPVELLLIEVPGLSWLENKAADLLLGDSVEAARETVAELKIPLGDVILENVCEKP